MQCRKECCWSTDIELQEKDKDLFTNFTNAFALKAISNQALRGEENNESSPLLTCSVHACPIVQSPKQLQGEDSSADFA